MSHTDAASQRYGGVKPGCAFLGFTSAYGLVVLIGSLAGAVAFAAGQQLGPPPGLAEAYGDPAELYTSGQQLTGYVIGAVALLVAYYVGGYVAGRMARFHGVRQGVAVWLWGLVIGALVAVLSVVLNTGDLSGPVLDVLVGLPGRVYLGIAVAVAIQLLGAVLGGAAGMRFHRRVDRAEVSV